MPHDDAGFPVPGAPKETLLSGEAPRLRILVVTAMYPHAGNPASGSFVASQVEGLRALGHHVDILHIYGYRSKWNYLRGAVQVFLRTWRERFDVVHAHYGVTGFFALARWRTPLVVTLHGSDALVGWVQPLLTRVACGFARAVISVSPEIARRFGGVVVPCGVDLTAFRPMDRGEARRQLGVPPDDELVLFPFDPARRVKRYDLATRAVERASATRPRIRLWVVHGRSHSAMPQFYSAADVLLLCSDSEGSPLVTKEAVACGLPIVTTDVGDVRGQLENVRSACIVGHSAEALAQGLVRALENGRATQSESLHWSKGFDAFDHLRRVCGLLTAASQRLDVPRRES